MYQVAGKQTGWLLFLCGLLLGPAAMHTSYAGAATYTRGDVADLELDMEVEPSVVEAGDEVTIRLTIVNLGAATATGVRVYYALPAGLTFVKAVGEDASDTYDAASGVWRVGDIAHDQLSLAPHWSMEITARPSVAGIVEHWAEVVTSAQQDPDSIPANGDPEEDDYASATLEVTPSDAVDLHLSLRADKESVVPGEPLRYELDYANRGRTATGVVLTAAPSEHVLFDEAGSTPGWQARTDGTYQQVLGDLNAGVTGQVVFGVIVKPAVPAHVTAITNAARITDDGQHGLDQYPADNEAEARTPLVPLHTAQADLALEMLAQETVLLVGEQGDYTLRLANEGPDTATHVAVGITLPDGLVLASYAGDGTYHAADEAWHLEALTEGQTADLTLEIRAAVPGTWAVRAEVVQADQEDPDSEHANGVETEDDAAFFAIMAELDAPHLLAPEAQPEAVALPVAFQWQPVAGARAYRLQIDLPDEDFNDPIAEVVTEATVQVVEALASGESYQWRVKAMAASAEGPWSEVRHLEVEGTPVSVGEADELPDAPHLDVYPNPFHSTAQVRFTLPHREPIEVAMFDLLGRFVRQIYTGTPSPNHLLSLPIDGSGLTEGLYFVRLRGASFSITRPLVHVK